MVKNHSPEVLSYVLAIKRIALFNCLVSWQLESAKVNENDECKKIRMKF